MLIRPAELTAIRDGAVDLAFRRWGRPIYRIGLRWAGEDPRVAYARTAR